MRDFGPEGVTYTENGFFNEASVEVSIGGQDQRPVNFGARRSSIAATAS